MRHKLKHFHLQGLRPRYVGDDHILVAANSYSECDRMVSSAVAAVILNDWRNVSGPDRAVDIVDIRKKKELLSADQDTIRSSLMVPDNIPAAAGEHPIKALHRYLRQATPNPNRRLLVICQLDAFTVDNTSLPLLLSLGREHGVRFLCAMTPQSCVANKQSLQSVVSACGVEVLGPNLEIKLGATQAEIESHQIKNSRDYCVFGSLSKMEYVAKSKFSMAKFFSMLFSDFSFQRRENHI